MINLIIILTIVSTVRFNFEWIMLSKIIIGNYCQNLANYGQYYGILCRIFRKNASKQFYSNGKLSSPLLPLSSTLLSSSFWINTNRIRHFVSKTNINYSQQSSFLSLNGKNSFNWSNFIIFVILLYTTKYFSFDQILKSPKKPKSVLKWKNG